jgi:hypothetical protein
MADDMDITRMPEQERSGDDSEEVVHGVVQEPEEFDETGDGMDLAGSCSDRQCKNSAPLRPSAGGYRKTYCEKHRCHYKGPQGGFCVNKQATHGFCTYHQAKCTPRARLTSECLQQEKIRRRVKKAYEGVQHQANLYTQLKKANDMGEARLMREIESAVQMMVEAHGSKTLLDYAVAPLPHNRMLSR